MPVTGQRNPFKTVHLFRVYAIRTFCLKFQLGTLCQNFLLKLSRDEVPEKEFQPERLISIDELPTRTLGLDS